MTIKLLQQVIDSLKFRHECKKGIDTLTKLDDHVLQDIGINRYDIESTVKNQLRLKFCLKETPMKKRCAKKRVGVHRTLVPTSH